MPFDTFKKSVHVFKAYFSFIEIGCIEVVLNEVGGDTMERSFKRIRIVVVSLMSKFILIDIILIH